MKLINKLLTEKKTNQKALPVEIQEEIKELKEIIINYNLAVDEVDEDDVETNKELDEKEEQIGEYEQKIVQKIENYFKSKETPEKTPEKAPEKTPERTAERVQEKVEAPRIPERRMPEPIRPQRMERGGQTEKKKDNSVGWLIFAGVVFAATLGAVNMMKKRA
jgi:hypothetical protein